MKVLVSAYACEPERGSEPGAGFQAVLAAAAEHEVWLLTRANNEPGLRRFFVDHPLGRRIHLSAFDMSGPVRTFKKPLGLAGMHLYYAMWQREAGKRALQLEEKVGFDVVHHATFANYWTSAGVAAVPKPFVWGPIGGGVDTPSSLRSELGSRGRVIDRTRSVGRSLLGSIVQMPPAAVTLVQNSETATKLKDQPSTRVLPNALAVSTPDQPSPGKRRGVVFVGRLIPWKGTCLAIRAFRRIQDTDTTLTLFGEGPDRTRVEREIARLGLNDRVRLAGNVSRNEVLRELGTAGAMLHTAFREEAGWAVAEALSYGTPVVCLDIGGPKHLADFWTESPMTLVPVGDVQTTERLLASALQKYLDYPPPLIHNALEPGQSFTEGILQAYRAAADSGGGTS